MVDRMESGSIFQVLDFILIILNRQKIGKKKVSRKLINK
jgi:hypothetical protein